MRSAILSLPDQRTAKEDRQLLRAALRQLERADIYLAAVSYMNLDSAAARAVTKLRTDLDGLYRHLAETRTAIRP